MTDSQDPGRVTTETRDAILVAALPNVAFDGWTWRAFETGAADAGYPKEMARRCFTGGLVEAAEHFSDWADRRMLTEFEKLDPSTMRLRDRVVAAVRLRLEALAPHREAVRRVAAFLALPQHVGVSARTTYETVNAVWYAVGDKSVDFSFYTKRGILAGVYGATVLYWLADESEDSADTWDFLARRVDDIVRVLPRLNPAKAFDSLRKGWRRPLGTGA